MADEPPAPPELSPEELELLAAGETYLFDQERPYYSRPRRVLGLKCWFRVLSGEEAQECDVLAGTRPTVGAGEHERDVQFLARGMLTIGARPIQPTGDDPAAVAARADRIRKWENPLIQRCVQAFLEVTAERQKLLEADTLKNSSAGPGSPGTP